MMASNRAATFHTGFALSQRTCACVHALVRVCVVGWVGGRVRVFAGACLYVCQVTAQVPGRGAA